MEATRHRSMAGAAAVAVALAALLFAVAGCGSTKTVTVTETETISSPVSGPSGLTAPTMSVQFGHIRSLKRVGGRYEMQFDPALMLMGETANRAAAEDGIVSPGEAVPNDNYVVDESKRTYTYFVAEDATVTLLVRSSPEKWAPTKESVAELAKVVAGTSALDLFEPLDSGTWITVDIDTVRGVYQQYQP